MLRSEHNEDSQSHDGNRTRDLSQSSSCFALMLNMVFRRCEMLSIFIFAAFFAATSFVFRMIQFALNESLNELNKRIIGTRKPPRKPLDKIRSRRMLLLALMVGLRIFQPCHFWYEADLISNRFVTSLRGRIVDTNTLTSVNEAMVAVSF